MPDRADLYKRILTAYGVSELERVKPLIGSRTLREAVRLLVDVSEGRAELYIPHYWALYYHDGRKGVRPILAQKLVFFDDPRDDPRLAGGYPERDFDIRTLTRDEYEAGLEENKRRRDAGLGPFMFVVDSTGPAAAHPFFDQLGNNAAARADLPFGRGLDEWIQAMVDTDPAVRPETGTAEFTL